MPRPTSGAVAKQLSSLEQRAARPGAFGGPDPELNEAYRLFVEAVLSPGDLPERMPHSRLSELWPYAEAFRTFIRAGGGTAKCGLLEDVVKADQELKEWERNRAAG